MPLLTAAILAPDCPQKKEWEYAAKSGGRNNKYHGAMKSRCRLAVYDDGNGMGCGKDRTWPVCSKLWATPPKACVTWLGICMNGQHQKVVAPATLVSFAAVSTTTTAGKTLGNILLRLQQSGHQVSWFGFRCAQ